MRKETTAATSSTTNRELDPESLRKLLHRHSGYDLCFVGKAIEVIVHISRSCGDQFGSMCTHKIELLSSQGCNYVHKVIFIISIQAEHGVDQDAGAVRPCLSGNDFLAAFCCGYYH